jgi:hypothetical protein
VAPPTGTDGFAITSLILGILPVFAGILGIVFGLIARHRIKRSGQQGKGLATAGVILGSLWLVGIIVAVAVSVADQPTRDTAGVLTSGGDVPADRLQLHDCLTELPEGVVRTVGVVPCDQPHLGEVYDVFELPTGAFPGRAQVIRLSEGHCVKTLAAYLGLRAGVDDGYAVRYLHPTASSWALGDHDSTCILTDPNRELLTGSAQGQGAHLSSGTTS